jgi:membrane protein DedA with SNARE-associated domain
MPLWKFQAYTFVGSWLWCLALAYAGMKLGEKWNSDPVLRTWFHRLDIVIVVAIGGGIAWLFWRRMKARSGRR